MKSVYSIEGNIGVGKSTLVEFIKNTFENVIVIPEPVDIWNTIVDLEGTTILEKYYIDPKKYAFSFQMMCYITRLKLLKQFYESAPEESIIITERCLYTDREIFAKMLYDTNILDAIEYSIYTKWFDEFSNQVPIHGILFLDVAPEVCRERISTRDRKGESGISMEYLQQIHEYHHSWIASTDIPHVVLDGISTPTKESIINSFNILKNNTTLF
jgi:deoxyadenosine/deoxycytidine kinase